MKTFKDLKVGDKLYYHNSAIFVNGIVLKSGYLGLYLVYHRVFIGEDVGSWYYIPLNHINANKVKIKKLMFYINERDFIKYYKKLMYKELRK